MVNRKQLLTSETKLTIIMMVMIGYIFSPAAFWFYISYQFESGAFPVNADSIGIPMAGFLLLWFLGWLLIIFGFFFIAIYRRAFGTNALD